MRHISFQLILKSDSDNLAMTIVSHRKKREMDFLRRFNAMEGIELDTID